MENTDPLCTYDFLWLRQSQAPMSFVSAALHFDISVWIFTRQHDWLNSNLFVRAQVLQMTFTVCSCNPLWICGSVFAYWLHTGCWPIADKAWASVGASCGQLILPLAVMPRSRSRPRGPLGIYPTQLRKTRLYVCTVGNLVILFYCWIKYPDAVENWTHFKWCSQLFYVFFPLPHFFFPALNYCPSWQSSGDNHSWT